MNPFLVREKLPNFNLIKPNHVIPAINSVIIQNKKIITKIESMDEEPNWANFVLPLEECSEKIGRVWSYINHINAVKSSTTYRKVYNQALAKITEYLSDLGQSERLYSGYKKLLKKKT